MEYQNPNLPQASYEGPASNQQVPFTIEPCTNTFRDDGKYGPGMFHLLKCGHIVAIDGGDTRCGINCQDTINIAQSSLFRTPDDLQPLTEVQRPDFLYCEVCKGSGPQLHPTVFATAAMTGPVTKMVLTPF
ncbi:hypothetical protein ACET3X_001320 [Alternaria dauci]|uniref:Uncharacterized protein n=1 Tax=Alternaria dauci TaxID=48095 RepID=A0ABR3UWZ9_9PLEO